jgi:hypothetical protein
MRTFHLQRNEDVSGVSGTGVVAEGIQFSSGTVVVAWIVGDHRSLEIHNSIEDCDAIHGHGGKTVVVWL